MRPRIQNQQSFLQTIPDRYKSQFRHYHYHEEIFPPRPKPYQYLSFRNTTFLLSRKSVSYSRWTAVWSLRFFSLMFGFGILSILVSVEATSTLDYSITDIVRELHGSNPLNALMVSVSLLGDISTLLVLAVVLTIIKRTRRAGMIFLTCILIIVVSTMYIKVIVGRDIPPFIFSPSPSGWQNKIIEPESVSPMSKDLSYPSSHIAIATCLACILELKIIHKSKLLASAIWFYPSLMALSRVYILQSYFTDVMGGFLLGLVVAVAMSKILRLEPLT